MKSEKDFVLEVIMKKFLVLLCLISLFCVNSSICAEEKTFYTEKFSENNYIFVEYGQDENRYIEKDTIRISKQDGQTLVDFWVISVYKMGSLLNAIDFLEKSGISKEKAQKTNYEKIHFKVSDDRFMAFISSTYYDSNDDVIYTVSMGRDYKWYDIIPNSNGENVYNIIFDYLKHQGLIL